MIPETYTRYVPYVSGRTVYARILRPSDGKVYDTSTQSFRRDSGAYADTAIALSELTGAGQGIYKLSFPLADVGPGRFTLLIYWQKDAAPAATDPVVATYALPLHITKDDVLIHSEDAMSIAVPEAEPQYTSRRLLSGPGVQPVEIDMVAGFQPHENWEGQTVSSGTGAADTSVYRFGTQGYKLTTTSDTTALVANSVVFNAADNDAIPITGIGAWIYLHDVTNTANVYFYLSESATFDTGNHYWRSVGVEPGTLTRTRVNQPGWNFVWFGRRGWSAVGSPTAWGNGTDGAYPLRSMRLGVKRKAGGPNVSVTFGPIVTIRPKRAGLIIQFDDAWASVYERAWPDLRQRGYPAVVPVICQNVARDWKSGVTYALGDRVVYTDDVVYESNVEGNTSTPGQSADWTAKDVMGPARLAALYEAGWDLISHTYSHVYAGNYTDAELNQELLLARRTLEKRGWSRASNVLVWPGNRGETTSGSKALTVARGFADVIRGTAAADDQLEHTGADQQTCTWRPEAWDQLTYFGMESVGGKTFAGDYQAELDAAVARKDVSLVYLHQIVENPAAGSIDPAFWQSFLAWVDSKVEADELEVMTFSEWYSAMAGYVESRT